MKFRWQRLLLGSFRLHLSNMEPDWSFFFSPPSNTHNGLLYLVLASCFISLSVFGRAELALRPLSQKESHCGPSAEEDHAELLLLVRHSSPEHCCVCPVFNHFVYWLIEDAFFGRGGFVLKGIVFDKYFILFMCWLDIFSSSKISST